MDERQQRIILCIFCIFNTMKLEEFVAETLKQIINGVVEAQEFAKDKGAVVVPKGLMNFSTNSPNYADKYRENPAQVIEFDVAVTTTEKNETSGKAGVFVSILKAGVEGKDGIENSTNSRLKFYIPINLPTQSIK